MRSAKMSVSETILSSQSHRRKNGAAGPLLFSAEWLLLGLVALISLAALVSATLSHQAVDWMSFFPAFGASLALMGIGVYIRATRNMPRMALGAIGFGVFMSFTAGAAIFIYTLFPMTYPLIDPALIRVDEALGFSWPEFVTMLAKFPLIGLALHYVYLSILPQVVGVIVLLAFLNRPADLHRFLAVGIIGMILTVGFWWRFPSVGPSGFSMVSPEIQAQISLFADENLGAALRRLVEKGVEAITADQITGVIAFPSFHIVMACMVTWFSRMTYAFVPVLLINVAMVPATIGQGGHHLVDAVAGLVTFAACLWIATCFVPMKKTA